LPRTSRGLYGINAQEYSSPSSSIIFPFLLSPFVLLGVEKLVPLTLGLLCNAASVWMIVGFFHRHAIAGGSGDRHPAWLLLVPLLLLSVNAIALPFVGMEHPMHLLVVVLTMTGLVRLGETARMNGALAIGVVMGPLIRFEGLALSGAVLLILFAKGHARAGLLLGTLLGLAFGSYVLFMHAHGLPLTPSSVLVKSTISADAMDANPLNAAKGMALNAVGAILIREGLLLLIASVALARAMGGISLGPIKLGEAGEPSPDARAMVAFPAVAAMTAHLLFGTYGWFGRYEVYVFAIMLLATCYVLSEAIKQVEPTCWRIAMCALGLTMLSFSFCETTWNTPAAARNVYEQQWQMHRFVTEFFPHPVAVNDLGAVSYRNERFVLDLWGLGSEEVRKLRKDNKMTADGIEALVQRRSVPLAMIYDGWFQDAIPARWEAIARLTTSQVVSADKTVTFYLTQPAYKREALAALRQFATKLPAGAKLDIAEQPPQAPPLDQAD
jgi:hypothetical protein